MPSFRDPKKLLDYIQKQAEKALQSKSVKESLIEVGQRHVQEDVYDVYTPVEYTRTGELKEDWKTEDIDGGVKLYNDRHDHETGKDIVYTIESGKGYEYPVPSVLTDGRPFVELTREDLQDNKEYLDVFKKELKQKGINVE